MMMMISLNSAVQTSRSVGHGAAANAPLPTKTALKPTFSSIDSFEKTQPSSIKERSGGEFQLPRKPIKQLLAKEGKTFSTANVRKALEPLFVDAVREMKTDIPEEYKQLPYARRFELTGQNKDFVLKTGFAVNTEKITVAHLEGMDITKEDLPMLGLDVLYTTIADHIFWGKLAQKLGVEQDAIPAKLDLNLFDASLGFNPVNDSFIIGSGDSTN
jgi:hypothetical protein